MNIRDTRKDYNRLALDLQSPGAEPFPLIEQWMRDASADDPEDFNAFVLSTASPDGRPSARVVLARDVSAQGIQFFTNHHSQKGRQLLTNPSAAATFFWRGLERQLRIVGAVTQLSAEASDAYFASRPRASQIGAWASDQSAPFESDPSELTVAYERFEAQFPVNELVPRPPHWGGFLIDLGEVEFWQGRPSRLHNRLRYLKLASGAWQIDTLNP